MYNLWQLSQDLWTQRRLPWKHDSKIFNGHGSLSDTFTLAAFMVDTLLPYEACFMKLRAHWISHASVQNNNCSLMLARTTNRFPCSASWRKFFALTTFGSLESLIRDCCFTADLLFVECRFHQSTLFSHFSPKSQMDSSVGALASEWNGIINGVIKRIGSCICINGFSGNCFCSLRLGMQTCFVVCLFLSVS